MTMAALSIAGTVISGFMQMQAQKEQGKSAQAEAEYKAAIDRNNAIRAEYMAEDAIARGKQEESQERLRGRLLLGQMRTVLAGSGQEVGQGSAGDLVIDQAGTNELDAQIVRNNAAREAQEYRIRGGQFESQANLTSLAGANAKRSADRSATSTLIGTGMSVANKWYQFDRKGAW